MQFNIYNNNIIHLVIPTRKELAETMIRFQEFYESPFEDIRGQVFTLGYLRAKGGRKKPGVNTYEGGNHFEAEWSGYNFPGYVLDLFIKGLFDPLTTQEQDIVNALRHRTDKFYVIGTYGDNDPGDTLEHELCHALYYVEPAYKNAVDKVLQQYDTRELRKMLLDWGYCEDVLDDEVHAYLSADFQWLQGHYKCLHLKKCHVALRKIRKKFPTDLGAV
jgi:hypothetical protein